MEFHRLFPWSITGDPAGWWRPDVAALIIVVRHSVYMLLYAFAITAGVLLALKVL